MWEVKMLWSFNELKILRNVLSFTYGRKIRALSKTSMGRGTKSDENEIDLEENESKVDHEEAF